LTKNNQDQNKDRYIRDLKERIPYYNMLSYFQLDSPYPFQPIGDSITETPYLETQE